MVATRLITASASLDGGALSTPLGRLKRAGDLSSDVVVPNNMAVAPTLTVSAPYGASYMPTGSSLLSTTANVAASGAYFTMYNMADWSVYFTYNGIDYYVGPNTQTEVSGVSALAFTHDGQFFEYVGRQGDQLQFIVDGKIALPNFQQVPTASGYSVVNALVDLGSRARRRVLVLMRTNGFGGLRVAPTDTIAPLDISDIPSMSVISDSYGVQDTTAFGGGGSYLNAAARLGFLPKFNITPGGGSGYVNPGSANKNFIDSTRVAAWLRGTADLGFVAGGINDSTTGMAANSLSLFQQFRAANPNGVLAVMGPWNPNGQSLGSGQTKRDVIKASLQQIVGPWLFIDNLAGTVTTSNGVTIRVGNAPWQTGDGRSVTFTAPLVAATSGTLTSGWGGSTGSYTMIFSDFSTRSVALTNGSTAVSWTGAVTASANAGAYSSAPGNSVAYISDGTHANKAGNEAYGAMLAEAFRQGILAL